jgi:hypothetical protein
MGLTQEQILVALMRFFVLMLVGVCLIAWLV